MLFVHYFNCANWMHPAACTRQTAKRLQDQRLVQYADRYATYNGSNPYQAPATLNVIPHLEQHFGAYFPERRHVQHCYLFGRPCGITRCEVSL